MVLDSTKVDLTTALVHIHIVCKQTFILNAINHFAALQHFSVNSFCIQVEDYTDSYFKTKKIKIKAASNYFHQTQTCA